MLLLYTWLEKKIPLECLHLKNLHFLLRYSDSLSGADTIGEHQAVLTANGSVWMGKFGVGMGNRFVEIAKKQISSGEPCSLYLMHGCQYTFKANVIDIVIGNGSKDLIPSKEPKLTPSYYRKRACSIWFKLDSITKIDMDELDNLWLYNDPSSHPSMRGMRGLIYLTYNDSPTITSTKKLAHTSPLYTAGLFD